MEYLKQINQIADQEYLHFGFILFTMIFSILMYYHALPFPREAPKAVILGATQKKKKKSTKFTFINSEEDESN
jgi:hypothetical protein